jgi:hypothetical protein
MRAASRSRRRRRNAKRRDMSKEALPALSSNFSRDQYIARSSARSNTSAQGDIFRSIYRSASPPR